MNGLKKAPWLAIWRLAVLVLLAWTALELHWARLEIPSIWDVERNLSDIESKLGEIESTLETISRKLNR